MLAEWSQNLVKRMIASNVIPKAEEDICVYGIEQGIRSVLQIALMLATGFVLGLFWQGIVILLAFAPVRVFAGGYHARTPMQCVLTTWLLQLGVFLWLKYIPAYLIGQIIILTVIGICIWRFCPIQDENKPLEEYEIGKYRKKTFILLGINVFVFLVSFLMDFHEFSRCISMGMLMLFIILLAGVVKNGRRFQ